MTLIMKHIKFFGLPRTCTNVVQVAIKRNFKHVGVLIHTPDWKHAYKSGDTYYGRLDDETFQLNTDLTRQLSIENPYYIICVKHPYAWLTSFHRSFGENQKHPRLLDFMSNNSSHYAEYGIDITPIEAFNTFVEHWLAECTPRVIVQQEMWAADQIAVLRKIRNDFDLEMKRPRLETIQKHFYAGLTHGQHEWKPNVPYIEEDEIEYINSNINHDLVSRLGYTLS